MEDLGGHEALLQSRDGATKGISGARDADNEAMGVEKSGKCKASDGGPN